MRRFVTRCAMRRTTGSLQIGSRQERHAARRARRVGTTGAIRMRGLRFVMRFVMRFSMRRATRILKIGRR